MFSSIVFDASDHTHTVIFLHGLNATAKTMIHKNYHYFFPAYTKMIFLQAPKTFVTCYGTKMRSWHDYYTDLSDKEQEDEINWDDIYKLRAYVHTIMNNEVIDYNNIYLFGESQGACCALDIALSFQHKIGGVYSSFGYLYSKCPIVTEQNIYAFHGTLDTIIPFNLMKTSFQRIANLKPLIQTEKVEHTVASKTESRFIKNILSQTINTKA